MGRGILLWLLGVAIPVIILLALFTHHWRLRSVHHSYSAQRISNCFESWKRARKRIRATLRC